GEPGQVFEPVLRLLERLLDRRVPGLVPVGFGVYVVLVAEVPQCLELDVGDESGVSEHAWKDRALPSPCQVPVFQAGIRVGSPSWAEYEPEEALLQGFSSCCWDCGRAWSRSSGRRSTTRWEATTPGIGS